jgi:hypothetical protein
LTAPIDLALKNFAVGFKAGELANELMATLYLTSRD